MTNDLVYLSKMEESENTLQKLEFPVSDMLTLRTRLSAVMIRDVHTIGNTYQIRSLYFDDLADKALLEKIDGVNIREQCCIYG